MKKIYDVMPYVQRLPAGQQDYQEVLQGCVKVRLNWSSVLIIMKLFFFFFAIGDLKCHWLACCATMGNKLSG